MKDDHVVSECAVFVGVSLDGVIAQPNGDLDWLIGEGVATAPRTATTSSLPTLMRSSWVEARLKKLAIAIQ
jgi:hypothetical protein